MCKKCQTNPVHEFTNKRKLCSQCFVRYFDKKFLYTNRKFKLMKKGDVISAKKDSPESEVLLFLLNKFKDKLMIRINNKNYNKIADSSDIDVISEKILDGLLSNKKETLNLVRPSNKKIIKPLYLFTREEILLYAKLNDLPIQIKAAKKEKVSVFLDEIEKKHPEAKRAVVNSFLKIIN